MKIKSISSTFFQQKNISTYERWKEYFNNKKISKMMFAENVKKDEEKIEEKNNNLIGYA